MNINENWVTRTDFTEKENRNFVASFKTTIDNLDKENKTAIFTGSAGNEKYKTSLKSCTCPAFRNTTSQSPCKHMFALARKLGYFQGIKSIYNPIDLDTVSKEVLEFSIDTNIFHPQFDKDQTKISKEFNSLLFDENQDQIDITTEIVIPNEEIAIAFFPIIDISLLAPNDKYINFKVFKDNEILLVGHTAYKWTEETPCFILNEIDTKNIIKIFEMEKYFEIHFSYNKKNILLVKCEQIKNFKRNYETIIHLHFIKKFRNLLEKFEM